MIQESWEHLDHQVGKVTQEILVTLEILVLQGHPVYTVNFRDPQDLQEPPGRQEFQVCMEHFFCVKCPTGGGYWK